MVVRSVHWHEGMSLWPHHMQQAERFVSCEIHRNSAANVHYNWGLRAFDLNTDSLGNFRFEVKSLSARLKDGSALTVPDETDLPVLDLKDALERQDNVTVFLAIPQLRLGKVNAAEAPAEPPKGAPPAAPNDDTDVRYWI